jgi:hypothetical protein
VCLTISSPGVVWLYCWPELEPLTIHLLSDPLLGPGSGENYDTGEDDKTGDNKVEECAWVLGGLCYLGTFVHLRILRTGVRLRLLNYSGQP